jgi:NarL family two-component system response regulator LiaR
MDQTSKRTVRNEAKPEGASAAPVQVMLVEMRPRSLDWLARKLHGRSDVEIAARAMGPGEAAAVAMAGGPGVVLVDIGDDPSTALDVTNRLCELRSDVHVILVEGVGSAADARDAVAAGAEGVLSIRLAAQPERLVGAIQVVLGGGYVSAGMRAGEVARRLRRSRVSDRHGLTSRELQVLRLVADGLSNREIADELSIAEQSAKNHVSNLLRKMGVANRTAAAAIARRDGYTG